MITSSRLPWQLLLLWLVIHTSLNSFAQKHVNTLITLVQEGPIQGHIQALEAQGFTFSYNAELVGAMAQVKDLKLYNVPIQVALSRLFEGTSIIYRLSGKNVLLRADEETGLQVIGKVYGPDGEPLPGATVKVVGTTLGTSTNAKGTFGLRMPSAWHDSISVSFIGMKTQTIGVQEGRRVAVHLEEHTENLSDVVVTGYNIEKERTAVTGSLTQIGQEQLESSRPMESFDRLLEGKIAGVEVSYSGGGEAGLPVSIRIRGQSTFSNISSSYRHSSAEPLYIVDGVPLYDITVGEENSSNANEQLLNPLSALNPYDIESITVLKDANASAIYGANAANGVILITTKKGKAGKLQVSANYAQGVAEAINTVKLLNSSQYVDLYKETLMNGGLSEEDATETAGSDSVNTHWKDYLLRAAQYQSFNLSLAGGSDRMTTRASFFYKNQESISKGNGFINFGGRTSSKIYFGEKFDASFNMALTLHRKSSLDYFASSYKIPPNISPYNADGSYNESGYFESLPNPVSTLAQNENGHKGLSADMNASVSVKPWPSLTLSGLGGLDVYQNTHTIYRSGENATGRNANGQLWIVDRKNVKWITNLKARWVKELSEHQQLAVMAGMEAQKQTTDLMRATGQEFMFPDLHTLSNATSDNSTNASSNETSTNLSYFGDVGYNIRKKYVLSATFRNDASSIFGGDVRNARFMSGGFAWNIDREDFLKGNPVLTAARVRSSYGSTGNARIGTYAAKGTYSISSSNSYDGNGGYIPSTGANDKLTWEKNLKFNIGTEFSLFSRFNFIVEYYQNDTKDAIAQVDAPYENGFQEVDLNVGHIRNSGWEWTLNTTVYKNSKVTWSINLNASKNKNIIKALLLSEGLKSTTAGIGYVVGEDTRTLYGMKQATVNPETGVRRWYQPDGTLTEDASYVKDKEDLMHIGTLNPTLFGGMSHHIEIGRVTLSILTPFSFGSDVMMADKLLETNGRQISLHNQSVNQLDRWQQPGDITYVPQLLSSNTIYTARQSTQVFNNSYIKLQNVSVTYQLPEEILHKWRMNTASVFVQASNVGYWYFTDVPKNRNGVAEYKYQFPEARTFSTGVNVSF